MKMNRLHILCLLWALLSGGLFAQAPPTIEIHQIDVGAGDATLIQVNTRTPAYNILIDAGTQGKANSVRHYLVDPIMGQLDRDNIYLDLVIASHYDADHIGGLVGDDKHFGILKPIVNDPAEQYYFPIPFYAVFDPGDTNPGPHIAKGNSEPNGTYQDYDKLAEGRRVRMGPPDGTIDAIDLPDPASPPPAVDPDLMRLKLGGVINLGVDGNGVPVRLRLIASNGYVLSPTNENPYNFIDVATDLGIDRDDPGPSRGNNNNWGLAWLLEYGQFKYYTGGDLGGLNDGSLFDMETPMAESMDKIIPEAGCPAGHVCAIKVNHHGSDNSSNLKFITKLSPTLCTISCGKSHGHPHQETIENITKSSWAIAEGRFNRKCLMIAMTELATGRAIPVGVARISGSVGYIVVSDVLPRVLGNSKKRFFKHYDPAPGSKKKLNEELALYQPDTENGETGVDGDFKICVYPQNGAGISIDQVSSFQLIRMGFNRIIWLTPELINCHTRPTP